MKIKEHTTVITNSFELKKMLNEVLTKLAPAFANIYKICVQKMKTQNYFYFTQITAVGRIKINILPHYMCVPKLI